MMQTSVETHAHPRRLIMLCPSSRSFFEQAKAAAGASTLAAMQLKTQSWRRQEIERAKAWIMQIREFAENRRS
eukprot:COSAG02_NODE_837_length_16637_cov_5.797859_9_plen_73_part_00